MDWYKALDERIGRDLPDLRMTAEEPMSRHTSFRVGGPARRMAFPASGEQLVLLVSLARECGARPLVIGNGTNLLVPDAGLDRLVICTSEMNSLEKTGKTTIRAAAGVPLARLADFAQKNGLAGLAFAHGIPGTVGGGVCMNAGAYGGELKDTVESVVLYYLPEQRLYELTKEQCAFGYRSSLFQKLGGCVILSAVFRLEQGDGEEIAARMRELNQRRREKQPLDLPSTGSAFKRPEGHFAAALIDQAGLKGFRVGGAQVSEKHAGFVVNTGSATSHDVYDLMIEVRGRVHDHSGVVLEPEMIILPPDFKLEDHGPAIPLHHITKTETEEA